MFYDYYFAVPECIRQEVEYVLSDGNRFKGIKPVYFRSSQAARNPDIFLDIIRKQKCDNDVLILCDGSCPEIAIPEEYSGSVKIHKAEHIYNLFTENTILQEYENTGAFIVVPGWLENWRDNLKSISQDDRNSGTLFSETYSLILIPDTGIHSNLIARVGEFSEFTGIPFEVISVGMEHFSLVFENLILRGNIEKKQIQLKICNKKAASYAMSIDFIKTIADFTDESDAIESICKLFSTMFAPKNVVYHSFYEGMAEHKYSKSPETEEEAIVKLKDSASSYIVFDTEDGFAIKVSAADEVLGIIEVQDVAFPEHLDEYISIGYDLAKVSGLAISNIRRYHEVSTSREEYAKLAEMVRTTNRILRHDIANDLSIINGALYLFKNQGDERYLDMIEKAAQKGASLIKNVKELDQASAGSRQFELLDVRSIVDSLITKHTAEINVTGDCMVMADKALSSVIDNIISNAFVHGNANMIDIGIKNHNGTCEISIADNGTGIPDKIKPRVFDDGYKYGKSGNTGFGLYIARKTVERYNGSIRVEDNKPSGAKFIIELDAAGMSDCVSKLET